jgi:hypothetical protein
MLDERALRRTAFVAGTNVVLADGQSWTLPERRLDHDDPEYVAMLRMVHEAEDRSEVLRAELALTIFLLSRNYELTPELYRTLLDFEPGDPDLVALQSEIHALALAQVALLRSEARTAELDPTGSEILSSLGSLLSRLRARWSLWHG